MNSLLCGGEPKAPSNAPIFLKKCVAGPKGPRIKAKPVYGELLFRQASWHATLLHPFLYVVDLKRALNFGEAQG
jgi:hypothetical protein